MSSLSAWIVAVCIAEGVVSASAFAATQPELRRLPYSDLISLCTAGAHQPCLPNAAAESLGIQTWPAGTIPVEFDDKIQEKERTLFYQACREWEEAAGITCRPRNADDSIFLHINADPHSDCSSGLGAGDPRSPGSRYMNLFYGQNQQPGCWHYATILHELGHTIGLSHEQQRPDRDSYITVSRENAAPGSPSPWDKVATIAIGAPYDILSIMHYSTNETSSNGKPIFLAKDTKSGFEAIAGNSNRVSDLDADRVRMLYGLAGGRRRSPRIDDDSANLLFASNEKLRISITGKFLEQGNGVELIWRASNLTFPSYAGKILAESANEIQFEVRAPDFEPGQVQMVAWVRVFAGAPDGTERNGTESAPVSVTLSAQPPARLPLPIHRRVLFPVRVKNAGFLNDPSASAPIAPGSILSVLGQRLSALTVVAEGRNQPAQLGGVSVQVQTPAETGTWMDCPLFAVTPDQINFLLPSRVLLGPAMLKVNRANSEAAETEITISEVAPAVFSANQLGTGPAAAQWQSTDFDTYRPTVAARADGSFALAPIVMTGTPLTTAVFLDLYATGLQGRSSLDNVSLRVGGTTLKPVFAGAQSQYPGLDQVVVQLPRSLAGSGVVDVQAVVDEVFSNIVQIEIR